MDFWFYCDDEDPVEAPEEAVGFAVCPDDQFFLKQTGKKRAELADWDVIFSVYRAATATFVEAIATIGIVTLDSGYGLSILAKDIPAITELLLSKGWKKEYIPFGP